VPALNTALEHARAPLLARMDADDVALSRRLELQARRLFSDRRLSVLGCRVRHGAAPGAAGAGMAAYVRWSNALLRHAEIARDALVESPLVHPSVMVRATLLRRLGGYRDFDGPEDYDLWLRALLAGARFAKLPQALLLWRDSAQRLTRRDPRYAAARFLALKLEALERTHLLAPRPLVIWGAGKAGKAWSRALLARGHRLAGFVEVDPRKLGQRIHGAPVWACAGAGQVPGALHLAAVPRPGARARIRAEAARHGLREGRDLVAVA
jgi:hypothetical protein